MEFKMLKELIDHLNKYLEVYGDIPVFVGTIDKEGTLQIIVKTAGDAVIGIGDVDNEGDDDFGVIILVSEEDTVVSMKDPDETPEEGSTTSE